MYCPVCGKQEIETEVRTYDSDREGLLVCEEFEECTETFDTIKNNEVHKCKGCLTVFFIGDGT